MANHIDPFAPGDSPQHPANWRPDADGEYSGPQVVVPQPADLAQRIIALEERHLLPAERERSASVGLEELERRQELVDAYNAGLTNPTALDSPIAVYIEDEGVTYRWEEAVGWVALPPAEEPTGSGPATPQQPGDDELASALAALDAAKGQ